MSNDNSKQSQDPFSSISQIEYSNADFLADLGQCPVERRENGFKKKLLESWKLAAEKGGVLNYEIGTGTNQLRELPGKYCLSTQLNQERCSKRRKPHRFGAINQPFDGNAWNFTKLKLDECLFNLANSTESIDQSIDNPKFPTTALLAINASPLSIGHSILIPNVGQCLPQILTADAVKIALEFALILEDNRTVIIYNSLMAHASLNHLHMQILFWPIPSGLMGKKQMLVASTNISQIFLLQRPQWYLPAFAFQIASNGKNWHQQIGKIASLAGKAVEFLIQRGMAHSVFICRTGKLVDKNIERMDDEMDEIEIGPLMSELLVTIFIFPRRTFDEALEADSPFARAFVPAALEVAGLIPVYDSNFFKSIGEENVLRIFGEYSLISDEQFAELAEQLIENLAE